MVKTWVLILSIQLITEAGELRDVQIEMIDGFTSKTSCETAGEKLAIASLVEIGKHIQNKGKDSRKNHPSVNSTCLEIIK